MNDAKTYEASLKAACGKPEYNPFPRSSKLTSGMQITNGTATVTIDSVTITDNPVECTISANGRTMPLATVEDLLASGKYTVIA